LSQFKVNDINKSKTLSFSFFITFLFIMFVIKRNLQQHPAKLILFNFSTLKQRNRHVLVASRQPLLHTQQQQIVIKRQLSIWTIPKIVLATTSKKDRGIILGTLGAATFLSSLLGPIVWVTLGGAASLVSWRLFKKAQSWWNYLSPEKDESSEPTVSQALLSSIGTHRAAELVRIEAIKNLKHFFQDTKEGKKILLEFGLDHPKDLVWEDVLKSETLRLDGNKHRISVNFWLEDEVSVGPKGGSCEVSASAIVSGQGNIHLEHVKLSSPGWHKDEEVPLT
jgi:hypothetical protein